MERERTSKIIAAYGADPARWPEDERDGVRAALSADLPLRRQAEDAASLDALLFGWAVQGPGDDETAARAAAEVALRAAHPRRRWLPGLFGGAGIAAAVAAAVLLNPVLSDKPVPMPRTCRARRPGRIVDGNRVERSDRQPPVVDDLYPNPRRGKPYMIRALTRAALLLAATAAVPALADAGPQSHGGPGGHPMMNRFGHSGGSHGMGGVLAGLTPEGRQILGDAMRETKRPENDALDVARDRVLQLLEADRLDVPALRRAMSEEHRLGEAQQQRRQEAMLAAFQKLSPRDRQAFSVGMRSQHFKMEQRRKDMDRRMKDMRERWGNRGQGSDGPPPAPAQPQR